MKWMRERDLLIAQTMAFVQSVTGKMPEAEKTVTASVALLPSRPPKPPRPQPFPTLRCRWHGGAARGGAAQRHRRREKTRAKYRPKCRGRYRARLRLARLDLQEDFQSEIKARVANFRAHQERFNREREAYCSATMAKVHATLREGEAPTPRNK